MSFFKSLISQNKSEKDFEAELSRALYVPNKQRVIEIAQKGKIELNNYLDSHNSDTALIKALNCSSEFQDSKEQLELIDYLIVQGTDVNRKNDDGFNALHVALSYHNLSKTSLLLLEKGNLDVNIVDDKHGNSPIFTVIREYGKTWREEQKDVNQIRFEIIKELLKRGADLDQINNHGISARYWIERIPESDKLHHFLREFERK